MQRFVSPQLAQACVVPEPLRASRLAGHALGPYAVPFDRPMVSLNLSIALRVAEMDSKHQLGSEHDKHSMDLLPPTPSQASAWSRGKSKKKPSKQGLGFVVSEKNLFFRLVNQSIRPW